MAASELTESDIMVELKEITDPHELGMHLGLKEEELKKIETEHPTIKRQKCEIIYHWKRNFKPHSWKALADAVEKMGDHANLAEKLRARALGNQELNDASQISEQESDTTSKSIPAGFWLNLSDRLNDRPTNKELREHVQKKIIDKWEEMAIELGLDDDGSDDEGDKKTTLDGIREKRKDNPNMAAYNVLNSWLRSTRIKPTWSRLIEALHGAGLQKVVESVTTYLSVSCQNSPSTTQATTAATAATAITQRTSTKEVLIEQNLEIMDVSTPQDSSSQPLFYSTKTQYEVSKQPREYQKELAEPRIHGQICAPTNNGKAFMAAMVNMLIALTNYLVEQECLPPYQELQAELTRLQKVIMEKAREQRMLEKSCRERHPVQDVELKCKKCKITACRGSDIYRIDKTNHHVVPGEEFTALYEKFEHHSRGILLGCDNPIIKKDYKIHCSSCNQSWGVLGTWPSGIPYPIIKCESFSFYINGNVKPFRKWQDRPFKVSQLSEWFTQSSPSDIC